MTNVAMLAVLAAAGSAAALVRDTPTGRLWARGTRRRWRPVLPAAVRRSGGAEVVALLGLGAAVVLGRPVVAVVGAAGAVGAHRSARRKASDRAASARREACAEACLILASALRAGRLPRDALADVADCDRVLLDPVATAASLGGDVPAALRIAAGHAGAESLAQVAAAWQVAERTGAGLAVLLMRTADGLRASAVLRQEIESQVGSVRSTARMLAVLPVVTAALGSSIGGSPVDVLLGTPVGLVCLAVGGTLTGAGLWWTDRLVRGATRGIAT